jgi:hypothetical protein
MKHFLLFICAALLMVAAVQAQEQPCAPCPEGAQCLLPECEEPENPEVPYIRLWNSSDDDLEGVTVRFEDQVEDYGDVASGQTTEYRPVMVADPYAGIEATVDGKPVLWMPRDYLGETPLDPGYYTYALDTNTRNSTIALALLEPVITMEFSGGFCVYGLCHAEIAIYRDGTYVSSNGLGDLLIASLSENELEELIAEMEATDFDEIRAHPFTDTCPIAYDGQEITYRFYTEDGLNVIPSCQYEIDEEAPLFAALAVIVGAQTPTE